MENRELGYYQLISNLYYLDYNSILCVKYTNYNVNVVICLKKIKNPPNKFILSNINKIIF